MHWIGSQLHCYTHPLLKVTPELISLLLLATTGCWVEWSTSICSLTITAVLTSVKVFLPRSLTITAVLSSVKARWNLFDISE